MANYNLYLYDDIGNKHKRKNVYLLSIALLNKKIKETDGEEKARLEKGLNALIKNKDKHPYNIRLSEFRKKEEEFLKSLKARKNNFYKSLDPNMNKKIKSLKTKLFESTEKYNFYMEYKELSYDSELAFKENMIIKAQLPEIILFLEDNERELKNALAQRRNLDRKVEIEIKKEIKEYRIQQKKVFVENKRLLKKKRKEGLISKKAVFNGATELKNKYKNEIKIKEYNSPSKSNKEMIHSLRHTTKTKLKQMLRVLKADIADLRRMTPVEMTQSRTIVAYLTFFIPGLGQVLNRQYIKGAMFFLVTLFTYLMAIPYALGYGNYQGNGIAGLISLAQGGLRIHKSLIFMIEGIIAILLLVIAFFLVFASFKDVLKVEKNKIKGIREKNWFETETTLKEEGFPYLVSLPAFIIITFILLVPVGTTLLLSFTGMDPQHQSKFGWVGLDNYELIALGKGLAGSVFWLILRWTVIWTLVATTLAIVIGFGLALLVNNERVKFKGFFRTIYLLPWAVPAFITIMFFSIMFSPNGAITEIINRIIGSRIEVKNATNLTRIALILLQGWLGSSYVFFLSTGVLQSIPNDLHEAAEMDGASSWKKTMRIVIPLVLFQTAPLLITQYTFNFNNFSIIHLFNGGGPFNPNLYGNLAGSSDLLISYIYKLTIENQYQAIGAAIIIVISLGLMVFAYLGFRNSKGFKEGKL